MLRRARSIYSDDGRISAGGPPTVVGHLGPGASAASALVPGLWLGVRALHSVYDASIPGEGGNAAWHRVAFGLVGVAFGLAALKLARR